MQAAIYAVVGPLSTQPDMATWDILRKIEVLPVDPSSLAKEFTQILIRLKLDEYWFFITL